MLKRDSVSRRELIVGCAGLAVSTTALAGHTHYPGGPECPVDFEDIDDQPETREEFEACADQLSDASSTTGAVGFFAGAGAALLEPSVIGEALLIGSLTTGGYSVWASFTAESYEATAESMPPDDGETGEGPGNGGGNGGDNEPQESTASTWPTDFLDRVFPSDAEALAGFDAAADLLGVPRQGADSTIVQWLLAELDYVRRTQQHAHFQTAALTKEPSQAEQEEAKENLLARIDAVSLATELSAILLEEQEHHLEEIWAFDFDPAEAASEFPKSSYFKALVLMSDVLGVEPPNPTISTFEAVAVPFGADHAPIDLPEPGQHGCAIGVDKGGVRIKLAQAAYDSHLGKYP